MVDYKNMDIEEFQINKYWKELERKEQLRSQLTLPATIVTILASVVIYYWQRVTFSTLDTWTIFLLLCCIFLSISIIAVITCLGFSLLGHSSYKGLPLIRDFKRYINDTYKYYQEIKDIRILTNARNDIDDAFKSQYEDVTDTATFNNEKKSAWIYRAYVMIFVSIVFAIIGFIPFLLSQSERIQKIEIVNLEKGGQIHATGENQQPESTPAITNTATTTTSTTTATTAITTTNENTTSHTKDIKGGENTPKTIEEIEQK